MEKKLEDLPINSLVKSEERGVFIKEAATWLELFPEHCSECALYVTEAGVAPEEIFDAYLQPWTAEEYLAPYKVIAIGVVDEA